MMNMYRIKVFGCSAILMLLFIQGCSLNNAERNNSGVIIGSYWVPVIPEWKKTIRKKDPFSNVTYKHSYEHDVNVMLKFVKFPDISKNESIVKDKKELLDQVKREVTRAKATIDQSGIKMTLVSFSPQEFHGLPAVGIEMTLDEGESFSIKKGLRFVENRNEYYLELTTTRKDKHYLQSKEGLKAWNHVIKGLKHVSR